MRWTIIILLCLGVVASANLMGKNRLTRMLKTAADHFLGDNEDNFDTSSDLDENDDGHDFWQQQHHVDQPRRKQQKKHCATCGKVAKRVQHEDEDEFDSFEDSDDFDQRFSKKQGRRSFDESDEFDQKTSKQRGRKNFEESDESDQTVPAKQHGRDRDREQSQQEKPCQPNYQLLQSLDKANVQLAAKLHLHAKQITDDRNTLVSPVAVQLALAALNQGASGNTKRQISQLIGSGVPRNQNQNAYAALARVLKGQPQDESGSKTCQIKHNLGLVLGQQTARDQFVESVKKCFDGEVKRCDFRSQHQQCRQQINDWMSLKTGQKSHQPLQQSALAKNTKMVAVSSIQAKANWGKQFRKNQKTVQGQFYALGDQKPTSVKMLQTEGEFNFAEDIDLQILGLQTQEKQLTIYTILPKHRHDLNKVEKSRLQYGAQLQNLMDECDSRRQTLRVQLPAFQIAYKLDAKEALRKLGIEDAFDGDEADFTNVQEEQEGQTLKHGRRQTGGLEDVDAQPSPRKHRQQLHLNDIHLFGSIQVGEQGLDASNGQSQSDQADKQKQAKHDEDDGEGHEADRFVADHAFAFLVKHNPSNQVIFVGRVVDATQEVEEKNE